MTTEQGFATRLRTIENPVIKDCVSFISLATETNGTFTEISVTLMPGGGTPLHFHEILTESFQAVSGTLGLQAGSEQFLLEPGSSMTVVPGTLHRFYNPGNEPVTFVTRITPGSTGFEQSLQVLYGLAADGLTDGRSRPRKLLHLAILSELGDMQISGMLSLLNPLLRRVARRAKRTGAHDALVQRYCRYPLQG